ncbi:MAG: SDR family oxidoreductase [Synoicihabitans sp.]
MSAAQSSPFPYSAIVLTGGSSGIGKSFLKHIETLNNRVPVCNLSRRIPDGFSAQLNLTHIEADFSDATARGRAFDEVLAFLESKGGDGPILLINNAGFGNYGQFHLSESSAQREIIEVNINALIDLTSKLLPLMRQRGGTVMNVASVTAFQPTPYIATYGATKAFLLHWGYSLDYELRDTPVRVMTVCPGSTDTAFHARAGMGIQGPSAKFAQTPDEVVVEAMRALERGRPHVVTGWSNKIMTTFGSWLPWRWATPLSGRVLAHLKAKGPSS